MMDSGPAGKSVAFHIPNDSEVVVIDDVPSHATTTRDDIRRNRGNIATELGFIGRVMHGKHPKEWLKELRARIGEPADYILTVAAT